MLPDLCQTLVHLYSFVQQGWKMDISTWMFIRKQMTSETPYSQHIVWIIKSAGKKAFLYGLGWNTKRLIHSLASDLPQFRHKLNKVMEIFLRGFGPYWHDVAADFLVAHSWLSYFTTSKRCWVYWTEIWWLWWQLEYNKIIQETTGRFEIGDMEPSENDHIVNVKKWILSATVLRQPVVF